MFRYDTPFGYTTQASSRRSGRPGAWTAWFRADSGRPATVLRRAQICHGSVGKSIAGGIAELILVDSPFGAEVVSPWSAVRAKQHREGGTGAVAVPLSFGTIRPFATRMSQGAVLFWGSGRTSDSGEMPLHLRRPGPGTSGGLEGTVKPIKPQRPLLTGSGENLDLGVS